jgi:hypothetical protein
MLVNIEEEGREVRKAFLEEVTSKLRPQKKSKKKSKIQTHQG